jgi:O-antigen ligase
MLGIVALQAFIGITQAVTGGAIDEFLIPSERRFYESIQLTTGSQQTWSPGTRVFATLGRYDQLGSFLAFFMLLAVGLLYQHSSEEQRRRLLTVLALASPALLLSGSRASWFGFILGLLAIGAWLMRDKRIRYGFAALIATAVLYAAWSGLAVKYLIDYPEQTVVERFFEAFSFERWRGEYYGLGRFYWMVQTPLVVVRSAPVFGVGPGQYGGGAAAALGNTTVYEKLNLPFGVYGTEGYIDNSWFALWGETGTLGLIFYAWMFWAMFRTALATWRGAHSQFARGLALGFAGCLVAVTFQAFLATYLEIRTLALYVWLYGALVFVLARREKVIT